MAAQLGGASAAALAAPAGAGLAGPAGTISTFAGGVGGPGPAQTVAVAPCGVAGLGALCGLTFAAGHLYMTDAGVNGLNSIPAGNVVRSVSISTGSLTTPAGNGIPGYAGDGGAASSAELKTPADLAVDPAGNVIIADASNDRVRVVAAATGTFYGVAMTVGDIYTVAGDGQFGLVSNGEPALTAPINPVSVAVDPAGNLVIGDIGHPQTFTPSFAFVLVVASRDGTFYGRPMTAGDVYSIAGGGKAEGGGGPASKASLGDAIRAVRIDPHGNVVLSDTALNRVRVIAAASGRFYGRAMTLGDIYTVAGNGQASGSSLGDGGPAVKAPIGLANAAIDAAGNLVIADSGHDRVRVVAVRTGTFYGTRMRAGDIYTVAGGGTSTRPGVPARSAFLRHPRAVTVDSAGNIVVADAFALRVRVIARRTGSYYGVAMRAGHVYTVAGNGQIWLSGSGAPATSGQLLPYADAIGPDGGLLVADASYGAYRSAVRFVAAATGTFFGQPMTAGDIYTVAGDGPDGYSGDGGPAVDAQLKMSTPHTGYSAITTDAAGNLIIVDGGNYRVRVVADVSGTYYGRSMRAGYIYTIAGDGSPGGTGDGGLATKAEFDFYIGAGVAVDKFGNIAIIQTDSLVRMIAATNGTFYGVPMKAGDVYAVAGTGNEGFSGDGGPALQATFDGPVALATDEAGNLVIADSDNQRIRVVAATTGTFYGQAMTAGDIYTVAGDGPGPLAGNGVPATSAGVAPGAVAVDPSGNLLITGANRVWVVAWSSGTFYGVAMTAGDIYTVAGTGTSGYSGDGGPATAAELAPAYAVANSAGMQIADTANSRIRFVEG